MNLKVIDNVLNVIKRANVRSFCIFISSDRIRHPDGFMTDILHVKSGLSFRTCSENEVVYE